VRVISATLYALDIPFVEVFNHSLAKRDRSGSIVVKLASDSGTEGFGEGVPRYYVTGETREQSVAHIADVLLPAVMNKDLGGGHALSLVNGFLPSEDVTGAVVWNAARCAVELALIDCLLRARNASLAALLPPRRPEIVYSGVISAGSLAGVERSALRLKSAGFRHVKLKVGALDDVERVGLVRDIMGPSVSLRLDANGAFGQDTAVKFLSAVAQYDIACIEQPILRGYPAELASLRAASPVPLMADESVVTMRDAEELIANRACDLFNLRISKCGGLFNTLSIAELAKSAGIGVQLGCQVGETAILSATGRHMAAHLDGLRFAEGSFGTHLLVEDVGSEDVAFGYGGVAPLLTGPGLGVSVREELLEKYSVERQTWTCR
jgi:muconate cycloisomerase